MNCDKYSAAGDSMTLEAIGKRMQIAELGMQ